MKNKLNMLWPAIFSLSHFPVSKISNFHLEAVLVVDAISGLGAIDLKTDEWACDIVVSGSQKGLMLPPGLGFISVSAKAWKLIEVSKSPRYYLDLRKAKKAIEKTDTPFTPAITLIIALVEVLKMIRQDGLENVFKRHKKMAEAARAAMKGLGLELFAPTAASDAVTAVKVPAGLDGEKLVKTMRDTYGVTIAGGQDELKGKVFRIAHMGFIEEFDIIAGISCLEKVLHQMGYKFTLGEGVKAPELRTMALFDAVVNNTDRKFGHILNAETGQLYGCDHGVSFHEEPKLRTVLWQFAGENFNDSEIELLRKADDALSHDEFEHLLTGAEISATRQRISELLEKASFPYPTGDWPAVPWPPY